MSAFGQPFLESLLVGRELGPTDADLIEAERDSELFDLDRECRELCWGEFDHYLAGGLQRLSIIAPMNATDERPPLGVYGAEQSRELDRLASERYGVPGYELMTRAASAAHAVLQRRWPRASRLLIYCGAGNNGGDGYVLARLASAAGTQVRVIAVTAPERLKGDAARAVEDCRAAGVRIDSFSPDRPPAADFPPDVLVDALLGTGADRPLAGEFAAAVETLNAAVRPVLALDVPSGLHADTGWPLGVAVRATVTVTFVCFKRGLFLGAAPDYTGAVELADLGLPAELGAQLRPPLQRLDEHDLRRALPKRARTAHKGSSGRLLLVGGGRGMPGAIRLAAEAALRSGAGLVYVATHASSVAAVFAGRPEIICRAVATPGDLDELIALADAAVVGPGLGSSDDWARPLWRHVLDSPLPLVVDADGLNLLAKAPGQRGRTGS